MAIQLEVPVFGPASAEAAVRAGAGRIELNAAGSYTQGGLTPTLDELSALRFLTVPVRVMIRQRGPPEPPAVDFAYAAGELDAMEALIGEFKASGLMQVARGDGFVFGVLRPTHCQRISLHDEAVARLAAASRPYKAVFHRAFDVLVSRSADAVATAGATPEWQRAMHHLIACGVDGILTSGGIGNAEENNQALDHIRKEAGDKIELIVGGGVRSNNIGKLRTHLGLVARAHGDDPWVHSSCLTTHGDETVDETEVLRILTDAM